MSDQAIQPPALAATRALNEFLTRRVFGMWATQLAPYVPVITSTYRTPERNAAVGGAANSAHVHGLAIDFVLADKNGKTVSEPVARNMFLRAAQSWPGYALFEPANNKQGYHIHLNLSRTVTRISAAVLAGTLVAGAAAVVYVAVRAPKKKPGTRGEKRARAGEIAYGH